MSGISTTSSSGVSTSAIVSPPSPCGRPLFGAIARNLPCRLRHAGRQLHPENPALVSCLRVLGIDVNGELDDAAERPRGKLDLLVGPPLGFADWTLTADHEAPSSHLEVDGIQLDPGQLHLHNRL